MMKTPSNRWLGLLGAAVIMWSSASSVVATTSDQFDACEAAEEIGNGRCNVGNNIEECGFDGGDCCECTCENGEEYTCGLYFGYACIDPEADCVDDDAVTVDMMENCYDPSRIGNGSCDILLNNEQCAYDGGDCCECTCDPSRYPWYDTREGCQTGMYGGFACIDPDAPCVDEDIVTAEMLDLCAAGQIGNGYCDDTNNSPECAYDGGDCCECTCVPHDDGYEYYCQGGSFACIDPEAECVNDDDNTADQYEHCGYVTRIGDGICDDSNNKEECDFDGGDCCSCTCVVQPWAWSEYACEEVYNINSFDCLDTSASCYGGSLSYDLSFDWDYSM